MKGIAFSVDVEPDLRTGDYKGIKEGIPRLEKLMDQYNIRPTLFITCDCIEKFPKIFKRLHKKGWEISLHGYTHVRFDDLSFKEKENNLKKSITCFKKNLGIAPVGFRAPQHSLDEDTLILLKKYNIKYDSSLTPWNFYHLIFFWKIKLNQKYNFTNPKIHYRKNVMEIPITSLIMPFTGFLLRVLPNFLLKIFFFKLKIVKYPVFFMHSWDLIEIPDSKVYSICPLDDFIEKLELLLNYFSKRTKFNTLEEIYHQSKLESKELSHFEQIGVENSKSN
ncbi:MAG: polysaccharide deacetylase family protein [Candidatus Pacearchaeota archaeon]